MAGVLPKGERLRKALRWIADERICGSRKALTELIVEACSRFNLSPLEDEFLHDFYADSESEEDL